MPILILMLMLDDGDDDDDEDDNDDDVTILHVTHLLRLSSWIWARSWDLHTQGREQDKVGKTAEEPQAHAADVSLATDRDNEHIL